MATRGKCRRQNVYRRGHTFYVDVRVNGERIRRAAGRTLEGAEALATRLLAQNTGNGRAENAQEDPGITFDAIVLRYLARSRLYSKPSSHQSAESSCRRLSEHFGGRKVGTLAADDVRRFIALRLQNVSREAVNRDLRYLKALLRLALEEGQIPQLPFKVGLLRTTKKLPTILTPTELADLFRAADDRMRPLLMTAAMTGLRHGELVALDWSDLDLRRRVLSVRAKPEIGFSPKSHAERQVPISTSLADVLIELRGRLVHRTPSDPVFQRNPRTGSRWESSALCAAVRATFQAAGLYRRADRPGLHMLRRSFASHVLARQADIQTVRELGGWSGLAVVERYVASTDALKREAVNTLDFLAAQQSGMGAFPHDQDLDG